MGANIAPRWQGDNALWPVSGRRIRRRVAIAVNQIDGIEAVHRALPWEMPREVECDDTGGELGGADQTQVERRSMGGVLLQAEFVTPPEFGNLDRALLQPFPRPVFGGADFFAGQFLGENCQQGRRALIASGGGYPKPMISLSEIDACAAPL